MSQKSVHALFHAVQADQALAASLERELENAGGDLVVAARAVGFEFSAADLDQACETQPVALNSQDLESVVGGAVVGPGKFGGSGVPCIGRVSGSGVPGRPMIAGITLKTKRI